MFKSWEPDIFHFLTLILYTGNCTAFFTQNNHTFYICTLYSEPCKSFNINNECRLTSWRKNVLIELSNNVSWRTVVAGYNHPPFIISLNIFWYNHPLALFVCAPLPFVGKLLHHRTADPFCAFQHRLWMTYLDPFFISFKTGNFPHCLETYKLNVCFPGSKNLKHSIKKI